MKGLEYLTQDITEEERKIVLQLIRTLWLHRGKSTAINNTQIRAKLQELTEENIKASELRRLIHYIRSRSLIVGLCSNSRGYYVADTEEELIEYIDSLNNRIDSIEDVRDAMVKQFDERYNKFVVRRVGNGMKPETVAVHKSEIPPPSDKEIYQASAGELIDPTMIDLPKIGVLSFTDNHFYMYATDAVKRTNAQYFKVSSVDDLMGRVFERIEYADGWQKIENYRHLEEAALSRVRI